MGCHCWHSYKPAKRSYSLFCHYSCHLTAWFYFSIVLEMYSVVLRNSVLLAIGKGMLMNAVPSSQLDQKIHLVWARHGRGVSNFVRNCLAIYLQEGIQVPERRTHKAPFFLLVSPNTVSFNILDLCQAHNRQLYCLIQFHRFQVAARHKLSSELQSSA